MTFNATSLRVYQLAAGGFVEWTPPRAPAETMGRIWLTREIFAHLTAIDPYFPRPEAAIVMGRFCAGDFVTVSRQIEPKADLKRLVDVGEVWELAFRKPKSGGQGRLLGRFAAQGIFVGLGIYLRDELGGDFAEAAGSATALWESMLPFGPLVSDDLSEYLNGDFRDMDGDD